MWAGCPVHTSPPLPRTGSRGRWDHLYFTDQTRASDTGPGLLRPGSCRLSCRGRLRAGAAGPFPPCVLTFTFLPCHCWALGRGGAHWALGPAWPLIPEPPILAAFLLHPGVRSPVLLCLAQRSMERGLEHWPGNSPSCWGHSPPRTGETSPRPGLCSACPTALAGAISNKESVALAQSACYLDNVLPAVCPLPHPCGQPSLRRISTHWGPSVQHRHPHKPGGWSFGQCGA